MEKTMTVIWYNPDIDRYENGLKTNYAKITSLSKNSEKFESLHEFDTTDTSSEIANNIVLSLNRSRN